MIYMNKISTWSDILAVISFDHFTLKGKKSVSVCVCVFYVGKGAVCLLVQLW